MPAKKKTALATTPKAAPLARQDDAPDFIKRGTKRGAEHITREDARVPRLCLAQGLSPQVQKGDAQFIEGLSIGDAFNDLTGEMYGDGTLRVIVVRADPPRFVEFDKDRNIVDRNVPKDDPRTQWTVDNKGNPVKPIATKFYDYVVLLGDRLEPMALSFKSSAIPTAKRLNSLLWMTDADIFSCWYEFTPVQQKNDVGTWYNFSVKPAGWIQDQKVYEVAKRAFETWREKHVEFDTTTDVVDPDDPDAEKEV